MTARADFRRTAGASALSLVTVLDHVLAWIERAQQRSALASLEPGSLRDLGLSSADVDGECRKHFWQR